MKKRLSITLALILALLLVGCSVSNDSYTSQYTAPTSTYTSQKTQALTEASSIGNEIVATTAEVTDGTNSNIEWTEFTYSQKDSQGYTFDITIKLSPWILLSNTDTVNKAWAEVGKNHSLPGFDGWGLNKLPSNEYSLTFRDGVDSQTQGQWIYYMNDMYYCMGTVSIKNTTDGWHFSEQNHHSVETIMTYKPWKKEGTYHIEYVTSIASVFFSNLTKSWNCGYKINADLNKDTWGPVPFIFMSPENFSPETPGGSFIDDLRTGYCEIYSRDDIKPIRVNIIGKNGEVFSPIINDSKD